MVKSVNHLMSGLLVLLPVFLSLNVFAEDWQLPQPEDISHITIDPQSEKENRYYTPESLLASLPHLRRANIGNALGFGKVWLWQRGKIHLKSGYVLRWRTFTDNIILIETDEGPVFFTDIQSQTSDYADNKIIRVINTENGFRKIEINISDIQ